MKDQPILKTNNEACDCLIKGVSQYRNNELPQLPITILSQTLMGEPIDVVYCQLHDMNAAFKKGTEK